MKWDWFQYLIPDMRRNTILRTTRPRQVSMVHYELTHSGRNIGWTLMELLGHRLIIGGCAPHISVAKVP